MKVFLDKLIFDVKIGEKEQIVTDYINRRRNESRISKIKSIKIECLSETKKNQRSV